MNEPAQSAPPRRRRWLRWLVVVLVLAVGLLVAAPWILSSLGRGIVLGRASSALGVPVEARSLSLSWTGGQAIDGLRVASPEGFGDDLLRVEKARVEAGLLGILFSSGTPLRVTVDAPRLHIERDRGGRFNFDFLTAKPANDEADTPPSDPGSKPESQPGEGDERIDLPGLPRAVALVVRGGAVAYRDALLETSGRVEEIEIDVDAAGETATAVARARFSIEGAADAGTLDASAHITGLGTRPALGELELEARVAAADVPVAVFRGLIEERLGLRVGEKPVSGSFGVAVTGGTLRADGALASDVLACESFTATIPLEETGELIVSAPRATLSLERLASLIEPRGLLPQGTRLAGSVDATIDVQGRSYLRALAKDGAAAVGETAIVVEAVAREVDVLVPLSAPEDIDGNGNAATSEVASARDPVHFAEPEARLRLEARGDPATGTLRIERATLRSATAEADLSGSLAESAERRRLSLEGNLVASLVELGRIAAPLLPPGTQIADGTRLHARDLRVAGQVGPAGSEPPTRLWTGSGRVELEGSVAVKTIALEGAEAGLVFDGIEARLENALARLNGGTIVAKTATVSFAGDVPSFELDAEAENVRAVYEMTPLLQYVIPFLNLDSEHAVFNGTLAGSVSIRGAGFGEAALASALSGAGRVRVRNGTVAASRFFEEAARFLGGDLGQVAFAEIGSDFRIGEGNIVAEKIFLNPRENAKVRNLGLAGTIGIDRRLDLGVDLAALHETIGDKKIRRILEGAQQILSDGMLPLKLRGTLDTPKLALDANLDAAGVRDLLDAIPGLGTKKDEAPAGDGAPPSETKDGKKKSSTERVLEDVLEGILGGKKDK